MLFIFSAKASDKSWNMNVQALVIEVSLIDPRACLRLESEPASQIS